MGRRRMDGYSLDAPRRRGHAGHPPFAGFRRTPGRYGATSILELGFTLEPGWSFVGSLALGLRPGGPAGPFQVAARIAGVILIAAATAAAAGLVLPGKPPVD